MNVVPSTVAALPHWERDAGPLSRSTLSVASALQPQPPPPGEVRLNFYRTTPRHELTLDDFELYALKRLKVLRKIEQLKMMRVDATLARQKLDQLLQQEQLKDNREIDEASHFILRLSYCQTDDLRRWFLQQECALFQHRIKQLKDDQLAAQVREYCQLTPITSQQKEALAEHLQALMVSPAAFVATKFYAVPFTQALDLVGQRQCYLRHGLAYVPAPKVLSILEQKFRAHLSRCLTVLSNGQQHQKIGPESARINPLLQNMAHILVNQEPDADGMLDGQHVSGGLTADTVLRYKDSMPLCMRQLQTGLQQDRKLKHWGRLQYGLFLKGAGLSLDDALAFFARHFTAVTGEQFQKQYAYSIRHMYGQEGKRATYTAYACAKIIHGNAPSAGDHHGCPYKHYDTDHLAALLRTLHVGTAQDQREILQLQRAHHFQLACQKQFVVQHPPPLTAGGGGSTNNTDYYSLDNVGNHPNAWFRASVAYREYARERSAGAAADVVSP